MNWKNTIISLTLAGSFIFTMSSCTSKPVSSNVPEVTNQAVTSMSQDLKAENEISDDVHVNQLGYKTLSKKIAVIKGQYKKFQVVDSKTGVAVLTGDLTGNPKDESSGDTVCYADFSKITVPGKYFISISGLGKSYDFLIDDNVYSKLGDAMLKALCYQRCGTALTPDFAGEYSHAECHKTLAKFYNDETREIDVSGGWHDAGDYGRYVVPATVTVAGLLLAYEFYPQVFTDAVRIPESGNKIPDVLDEAKYGIEWLLKMQDSESGGVYHKVTSRVFPEMTTMPDKDVDNQLVMSISTNATADFAAVTAMASRIYVTIDPVFSQNCLQASQKAWEWLEKNKDFVSFKNPSDVASGEYGDSSGKDEKAWAAAELFRATGNEKYNEYFTDNYQIEGFGLGWQNVSGFAAIAYMFSDVSGTDQKKVDEIKKAWLDKADMFASTGQKDGYLVAMHKMEYNWGSNMNVATHAMHLLISDRLKTDDKYIHTAEDCTHYLLGRNTLNQSYITGFGSKQVKKPHHRPSAADLALNPVPGLMVGGPDSALEDDVAKSKLSGKFPAECYIDDINSFSTNEVATYWNSPVIFILGYLNSNRLL
ncbi:glycoside hydrolase family 9 protein [Ruminiclostridium cellulolyticum]|uniref:Endoglucanase n=1 Tax=Ruminiclostridium cellulolyticum (strain ATCC 35319 / DSM 5812 / JCM 6584 / H10) TaxID=394503 RepID=B8I4R4_RUMCH|nr:glycoside hydrolase family 9 protein [Ruminiclostridium cellulolyticum]ACL76568.1 glycoside hydrolase family 9 [Ruminiclostridium cellulolyticum H10]